ncbi:Bifunctional NAD(P)H-hydrate repair enzyme Nnr [Carnimonas sp. R-84981]|uniref:NAD(P)H-hydrate dehydratase n=1 Tax=Carnimonas bestiolae TaxID=3402172 RepID=UPI003EDC83B6
MSQPRHTRRAEPTPVLAQLYSAAHTRELDRLAMQGGLPGFELMRRAGESAFTLLRKRWPSAHRILVLCGAGNNAGDGYVVAALARRSGLAAEVLALKDPETLTEQAAQAYQMALEEGVPIYWADTVLTDTGDIDLIVDGLLGTGTKGAPRGRYHEVIDWVNEHPAPVLALDLPSGVDADTGHVEQAIEASVTLSFIGRKLGLYTGNAADVCGERVFDDLGIEAEVFEQVAAQALLLDHDLLPAMLPPRLPSSHKGHTGLLLVVGGQAGFGGSCIMVSEAAARVGAGLVSLATDALHLAPALARCPVLMVRAVAQGGDLTDLLQGARAIAVGPGLGRSEWGQSLLAAVLESGQATVVDADALHLLHAHYPNLKRDNWILTPHPGEAAAMLGISAAEVQADRLAAAQALWQQRGGVIVLKGNGTLIVDGSGCAHTALCPFGNPGMASGGMGDVLTGIIAGLLVQGLAPADAARTGVLVHAMAADSAAEKYGERGLMASDLASFAHRIVNPSLQG